MTALPQSVDGSRRILIADDDADICELIAIKLRGAGHALTSVADGDAAYAALDAAARGGRPFDLAVLDVTMPGRTGLDVCAAVKSDPASAVTRVLLLTARAQTADLRAGTTAGADDYLIKPFSPRELASRVQALLARDPA